MTCLRSSCRFSPSLPSKILRSLETSRQIQTEAKAVMQAVLWYLFNWLRQPRQVPMISEEFGHRGCDSTLHIWQRNALTTGWSNSYPRENSIKVRWWQLRQYIVILISSGLDLYVYNVISWKIYQCTLLSDCLYFFKPWSKVDRQGRRLFHPDRGIAAASSRRWAKPVANARDAYVSASGNLVIALYTGKNTTSRPGPLRKLRPFNVDLVTGIWLYSVVLCNNAMHWLFNEKSWLVSLEAWWWMKH